MRKLFFYMMIAGSLFSCGHAEKTKTTDLLQSKELTKMVEGKDYMILKRFRVADNQGFNQPVEASSFLLPADWQVNSAIQWDVSRKCIPEMVQASIDARSPDGSYELMMYPVTQFDWSDDPVYLDAMQRGFNLHSCNIAQPQDAAGYIAQQFAPMLQAQVRSSATIDALQQMMDAGAMQMTNMARQGGNNAYNHRGSAAEGILQFNDGMEGIALCTLMQTIVTLGGTQGGMANTYQCYVSMRMVMKYKPGNEQMARKILSTFFGGARINPQWATGVQNFFLAVGKAAQDETWKVIQISHEAQEEIGNNIIRSWEARNERSESTASIAESNSGFSQYLRGVDSWTDESGARVELTDGYRNAWSRNDGTYLLSNDPAFDPNVAFNESWSRLKQ